MSDIKYHLLGMMIVGLLGALLGYASKHQDGVVIGILCGVLLGEILGALYSQFSKNRKSK